MPETISAGFGRGYGENGDYGENRGRGEQLITPPWGVPRFRSIIIPSLSIDAVSHRSM
jgi:hypothetical protein